MQRFPLLIGLSFVLIGVSLLGNPPEVKAQSSCNYFAGTAVNGQSVNVDLCSISRASSRSINFIYYLGNDRINSQANCQRGTWTTFPEKQVHRPQSKATQRMMDVVCNYQTGDSQSSTAYIFDPPSNIRTAPNGNILCSVSRPTTINIYGSTGSWYYTDACGTMGVIHISQIRF